MVCGRKVGDKDIKVREGGGRGKGDREEGRGKAPSPPQNAKNDNYVDNYVLHS